MSKEIYQVLKQVVNKKTIMNVNVNEHEEVDVDVNVDVNVDVDVEVDVQEQMKAIARMMVNQCHE